MLKWIYIYVPAGPTVWHNNSKGSSAMDLASPDLQEKLKAACVDNIHQFEHLNMKPIEVDILGVMISAYVSAYPIKENCSISSLNKPDKFYKFNYTQYHEDETTLENLLYLLDRLHQIPGNPGNLKNIFHFLKTLY